MKDGRYAAAFAEAALTINLLHLVPKPFVSRLFEEVHRALSGGGRMIVYGHFLRGSAYASECDRAFDTS
ncbi:DUF938 domain-containing protein [Roseibium sp.]|uniref:DUF938 domain-containing protein n=1 Tax=Roseibium sp. TaxID=1936156 RepID=UPI0039F10E39